MEELHTDSIDGGHEASYGARLRARERAYSNKLLLTLDFSSVSFSSNSFTTASCPFFVASNSGVLLKNKPVAIELTSTLSVVRSSLMTASCPFSAVNHSGVRLSLSLESGSMLSVARSSLTTASCPFLAAYDSGVP
jgi:hypothetical protein